MASGAPRVKLLRQLATAKDDFVSGALDIAWEGGSATIYVLFGLPTHAQLSAGGRTVSGRDAVEVLPHLLPQRFEVSYWRRRMSPADTLDCSIDDLAALLIEFAGAPAAEPAALPGASESWAGGDEATSELAFGLAGFPPLPHGSLRFGAGPAAALQLPEILPKLAASLVSLEAPGLRAAGVVIRGDMVDAVWVEANDCACGDTAAIALRGVQEGTVMVHDLEPDVAAALPLIWRLPVAATLEPAQIDAAALVAALTAGAGRCALLVAGHDPAVALVSGGSLVAVYSAADPVPSQDPERLRMIIGGATGCVTVLQRDLPGHDPATVRAAAREMHQCAAEPALRSVTTR
ncbi:MAG: hypothetical protein JOY68_04455 [Candidatus Dormibacteraeota bacterium]|nr:hypothetical protein [Candidatus Dormibacteraeota bacterium]